MSKLNICIDEIKDMGKKLGFEVLEEKYRTTKTKMKCLCPIHGEFYQSLEGIKQGRGCPKCGRARGHKKRIYPFEYVREFLKEVGLTLVSDKYVGSHDKMRINCPKHGEFTQTFSEILQGHRCPKCGIEKRAKKNILPLKEVIPIFEAAGLEIIEPIFKGTAIPIRCLCKKHGIVYATYNSVKRSGLCPVCGKYRDRENNPSWKGGLTKTKRYLRESLNPWRTQCLKKAHFRCEITGKEGDLEVHHMTSFEEILDKTCKETRLDVRESISDYTDKELQYFTERLKINNEMMANPIVMLKEIHQRFHSFCGGNSEPTTYEQLNKFISLLNCNGNIKDTSTEGGDNSE